MVGQAYYKHMNENIYVMQKIRPSWYRNVRSLSSWEHSQHWKHFLCHICQENKYNAKSNSAQYRLIIRYSSSDHSSSSGK